MRIVFLLLFSAQVFAQNTNEQLVTKTIELYFDGWMTGDTTKVGQAMHSTCHLKLVRDGQFVDIDRNTYLSRFTPHAKAEGTEARIMSINITGTIASAKCEIETKERIFTDYFNMLLIKDKWYIVDKISTSIAKSK